MSDYRVFETEEFLKSLAKLSPSEAEFVSGKLRSHAYPQLREAPYFGPSIKKLRGYDPQVWRYRIGRYRVFYAVDDPDRTVFILTVDRRKDAYR